MPEGIGPFAAHNTIRQTAGGKGQYSAAWEARAGAIAPHPIRLSSSERRGGEHVATTTLSGAKLKKVLAALEGNWQAEMEGYHTYLALAERDTDPVRAQVLRHLAGAEWEHAALWHGRIVELGGPEPVYNGKPGGEADSLANRAGGVRMALRRLEIEESRAHRQLRRATQGAGRRGIHRHPRTRHRGREGSLPRAGIALARPLHRPRRRAQDRRPGGSGRDAGQAQPGPQAARQRGSATPSTASTTAWAPSSASSPASPAQPPATANTCCWPGSPA